MLVQINTDHNINGREAVTAHFRGIVENELSRFSDQITRVEVYLTDENSDKKGGNDDMRCVMEAQLEGRKPVAVTHQAATLDQSVDGAVDKLSKLIKRTIERLRDEKRKRMNPLLLGTELTEEL